MATTTNKRKKAVAATVAAAAILLAGTFAWTSISQQAKNEAIVDINPGGRLHDDFDGSNKDVYVENFNDGIDAVPIYARIRLSEYMEVGQEAGNKTIADDTRKALAVGGGKLNDPENWDIYVPGETTVENPANKYSEFWGWTMGNDSKEGRYYMPTFNKNKDCLEADINGTYEGTVPGDIVHYDNYKAYKSEDDQKTDTEYYDWDSDTLDEPHKNEYDDGGEKEMDEANLPPLDDADVLVKKNQTHNAKPISKTAEVILMKDWDGKAGDYWVYDTDGWAYWANPIAPGETTGLLLDGIQMDKVPDDNWYYGINVEGQFVTQGDFSAFTDDGISDEALKLLDVVTNKDAVLSVDGPAAVMAGDSGTYTATLKRASVAVKEQPKVTWSLASPVTGISINETTGVVTVAEDVAPGTKFVVQAAAEDPALTGSKTVTVAEVPKGEEITLVNGQSSYFPIEKNTETSYVITLQHADLEGDMGDGNFYVNNAMTADFEKAFTNYTFDAETRVLTIKGTEEALWFCFEYTDGGSAFEAYFLPIEEQTVALNLNDAIGGFVIPTLPDGGPTAYKLNFTDDNGQAVQVADLKFSGTYYNEVEYDAEKGVLILGDYFDYNQMVVLEGTVNGSPVYILCQGESAEIEDISFSLDQMQKEEDGSYSAYLAMTDKTLLYRIAESEDSEITMQLELEKDSFLPDGGSVTKGITPPSFVHSYLQLPAYGYAEDDDVIKLKATVVKEDGSLGDSYNLTLWLSNEIVRRFVITNPEGQAVSLKKGDTYQFAAEVETTIGYSENIVWSVEEKEGVSIDEKSGLLTISGDAETGSINVTAAPSADPDKAKNIQVVIME